MPPYDITHMVNLILFVAFAGLNADEESWKVPNRIIEKNLLIFIN